MSAVEYRFLTPLDVLFLRGNKLFGDPGSYGEALVPPWPSVAAGAMRSRMLVDAKLDLAAFARGEVAHPELGTPQHPGAFSVTEFNLALRHADGTVEALISPPADLVISEAAEGPVEVRALAPQPIGLSTSFSLPKMPVLAQNQRSKPAGGYWLRAKGWEAYLKGQIPHADDLIQSTRLWRIDPRVGVGLDAATGSVSEGRLFSVQAVALRQRTHSAKSAKDAFDVGFLLGVQGAQAPADGLVRLGGDGRAAAIHPVQSQPSAPDYAALARARRCRLVLTTPGIFPEGWKPCKTTADHRFQLGDLSGRLVCAAVPRAEVVSGWDLAKWQPKTAQRAAPSGSVYWLEDLQSTAPSLAEALRQQVEAGLWNDDWNHPQRRAEGFNRFIFAAY